MAMTEAANLEEVINIFLSSSKLFVQDIPSISKLIPFYKTKNLTAAELAVAVAAQASHDRMTSHTHDASTSGQPPYAKLKALWIGGGHKRSALDRSLIIAPTAHPL
jgi:hypothetical protein